MTSDAGSLTSDVHEQILRDEILPKSGMDRRTSHEVPKAIILAGQPGSGKGALARQVRTELNNDVITVDPDELREEHRHFNALRQQHPYTWAGHTHSDASEWAKQLRSIAVDGRKNLLIDTTLGNGESAVSLIKNLLANGYEIEIRGVVAHRLESELGVDGRFTTSLDTEGFGRYVPEEVRKHVYEALPGNLDEVQAETGIQIKRYGREGAQVYDSHSDTRPLGVALEAEREAQLKDARTTEKDVLPQCAIHPTEASHGSGPRRPSPPRLVSQMALDRRGMWRYSRFRKQGRQGDDHGSDLPTCSGKIPEHSQGLSGAYLSNYRKLPALRLYFQTGHPDI